MPAVALQLSFSCPYPEALTFKDSPFVRQFLGAALTLAASMQTGPSAPGNWSNKGEAQPAHRHWHTSVPWEEHRLESSFLHPQHSLGTASFGTLQLPGWKNWQEEGYTS